MTFYAESDVLRQYAPLILKGFILARAVLIYLYHLTTTTQEHSIMSNQDWFDACRKAADFWRKVQA